MVSDSPVARYFSEFIGTYVLVFTVGCNVLSGQPVWGGISIACALMVMIYALAASSGANFNPAVSLALALAKKLSWVEMIIYWACQMAGGILAAFSYNGMFDTAFELGPTKGHSWMEAGASEMIYTCMLCFVVLNVATAKRDEGNNYYGLAIGFVIVAGAYSGGSVSMGCFNPAVAFGIELSSLTIGAGMKYASLYALFEFVGAALAVFFFLVVRPEERDQEALKENTSLPEVGQVEKLVAEFLGTFVLVVTVGLNVLSNSTAGALSIASSLMCMIYALASVSGANFNPAVTVALMLRGGGGFENDKLLGLKYIVVQLIAGIAGAFTFYGIRNATFALRPDPWHAALLGEFVFTFVLAFVVLGVASTKKPLVDFYGFAIGMCVTLGGNAVGKVSGGSLNPAVSIGISTSHIMSGGDFWVCIPYALVEILAGGAAAGMFALTHPSEMQSGKTEKERDPEEPSEITPLVQTGNA